VRSAGRPSPAVAGLVLLSGAFMVWTGYLLALHQYSAALWVSLPPGVAIEIALWLVRRSDRASGRPRLGATTRLKQEAIALFAGALMVLAGYAGRTSSWLLALLLVGVGGAAINAALGYGRGAEIHNGRFTADVEGDFVVFIIGMRFNKPLKIHKWLPVAMAMPKMLRALDQSSDLGCLGYRQWYGPTTVMVQYWRDFESLDRFARDGDLPHLEPWRRFNRAVRDSGDVGIYHETYRVHACDYETVYANMPVFGLAAATRHVRVEQKGQTSADRLGGSPAKRR
jgi:fumigallin biosynthesis monooxygenase-like protein